MRSYTGRVAAELTDDRLSNVDIHPDLVNDETMDELGVMGWWWI